MAFHGFLKKDTNTIVSYGPFVASADGETPQTGLTINQADIILSKTGAAWASKAATGGATAAVSGFYRVNIGTGDSNTVGVLDLFSHVSPALYVKQSYVVLPALVYDSLIAGSDFLQVDTHQASGSGIGSLLDVATSSRIAATATGFGNWDRIDVGLSSRLAATATGFGNWERLDVALSSRMAGTATGFGNWDRIDVGLSSRLAGTATGLGNLDVVLSSRMAGTATGFGNWDRIDVGLSSRLAATATGFGNWERIDSALSSRLAGTATGLGNLDVAISSRLAGTAAILNTISGTGTDIKDFLGGTYAVDITGSAASAYRMDGTTLLKAWTLSAAAYGSAVPAFVKRTV